MAAGPDGARRHPRHAGGVAAADAHRVDRAVVRAGAASAPPRCRSSRSTANARSARCLQQAGVQVLRRARACGATSTTRRWRGVCRRRPAARSRRCRRRRLRTGLPEGDPSTLPAPPTDGDAVRWLYSTSGTTAAPKCVMHSDGGLIAGGIGLAHALEVAARRRRLDGVPVHAHRRARLPRRDARARHARGAARDVRPRERGRDVRAPRRHHGRRQHRVLPRVPQRAAQGPVEAGDARRCG